MFEIVEHTADVGLRISAPALDQLLNEAARALFTLLVPNGAAMVNGEDEGEEVKFLLPSASPDDLLVDWLTELLFVFESRHLLLRDFDVKIVADGLQATVRGEMLDSARHAVGYEIKAVTYHRLKVEPQEDHWVAEVVLDV